MTTLARIAGELRTLLTATADAAAHDTRFVQRRSKLTGARFAQTLVFGRLANPQATLEGLAQTAATLDLAISPRPRLSPAAGARDALRPAGPRPVPMPLTAGLTVQCATAPRPRSPSAPPAGTPARPPPPPPRSPVCTG